MKPDYLSSEMRRADLAWTDWPAIQAFLRNELICRVAVHDFPYPYVIAQSYTFTEEAFLIHCSRFGKFASKLLENPHVTIEIDRPTALLKAPKGQNTSLEYYSVVARCQAELKFATEEVIAHQNQALGKFRPEKGYAPILADGQYSPPGQPKAPYIRFPFADGASISGLPEEAFRRSQLGP